MLIPCRRATSAGRTSGRKLSSTISRFCSIDHARRRSPRVITSIRGLRVLLRSVEERAQSRAARIRCRPCTIPFTSTRQIARCRSHNAHRSSRLSRRPFRDAAFPMADASANCAARSAIRLAGNRRPVLCRPADTRLGARGPSAVAQIERYCDVSVMLTPPGAKVRRAPCEVEIPSMTTPFWFRSMVAAAPPASVAPAEAAT